MDQIPLLHNILYMYHDNVDVRNSKVQNDMCKYFESLCQMQNVLKLKNLQEVKIRVTTGLNAGKED